MRANLSLLAGLLLCLTSSAGLSYAGDSDPQEIITSATASAKSWLTWMDRKEFTSSYDSAGTLLHQEVTLEHWMGALNAIRGNFGTVQSRELATHNYFPQGIANKEGEFVELDFKTKFSQMNNVYTETIVLHHEGGSWLAVGYSLTPPDLTPEQQATQPIVEQDEPQETKMSINDIKPMQITHRGNDKVALPPSSVDASSSDPLPK